ncbi:MAG: protein kinase [Deltaproteobacteria bacterium]|nr:protein kinase [Deltaproteobacteria bacterium]
MLNKLGSGGMAEVYRAKMLSIDGFEKQLAIKRILPNYSEDKHFIEMLVNEARLSVQLSHSNIVQIHDFGKNGNDYFMTMEFVFGTNLHDILTRLKSLDKKLPTELAVYAISEVCRGLDYAHAKCGPDGKPMNVIHRDVSPPNILVSYEGEVKIADFGIAKAAMNTSHTESGIIKGKVCYMSPEQAKGEHLDSRSDIFSVGMVLYELLTEKKFFSGDTQFEILRKIQNTHVEEKDLDQTIPSQLKTILAKSLAHDRDMRFSAAGDMQMELHRYLNTSFPSFTPRQLRDFLQELYSQEIEDRKERVKEENQRGEHLTSVKQIRNKQKRKPTGDRVELASTDIAVLPIGSRRKPNFKIAALIVLLAALSVGYLAFFHEFKSKENATSLPASSSFYAQQNLRGKILIQSVPDEARVFIDGIQSQDKTPTLLENIPVGKTLTLSLKKEGFEEWVQKISLADETPLNLKPLLVPSPKGMLVLSSSPSGARIYLDNQDTGKVTPAIFEELEINKATRLRLEVDGFVPLDETFTLVEPKPLKLERSLVKIPTTIKAHPIAKRRAPTIRLAADSPDTAPPPEAKDSKGNAFQTMGKGFKKAGSSIKSFFGGGNKEEKQEGR